MPDSELPTGKTILQMDPLVGEVDKASTFIEVHVVGQETSKKVALNQVLPDESSLPEGTEKLLETMKVAVPAWFDVPFIENAIIDLVVEDKRVTIDFALETPWSGSSIDWGDGSTMELPMDNMGPKPIGGQGYLGFKALPQIRDYNEYGAFIVTIRVWNAYGTSETTTRQVNLTASTAPQPPA